MSHQYEIADFKEAIDLDGKYRLRVFEHGKRFKLKVESIEQPIVLSRPQISVDTAAADVQTKGRQTT